MISFFKPRLKNKAQSHFSCDKDYDFLLKYLEIFLFDPDVILHLLI